MKRTLKTILVSMGLLLITVAIVLSTATTATAATKSKKAKSKAKSVMTADEKQLNDLIAYRDALVKAGAAQADIDFANSCITVQQKKVDDAKLLAQQQADQQALLAQQQAAQQALFAQQQEALKAQQAALKAQQALVAQQLAAAAKQQAQILLAANAGKPVAGYIFVGDSRIVQMHDAVGDTGVTFIGENSKGYDWFVSTAIPRIDNLTGKGTKIVINLGVNDPGNIEKYITEVNAQAAKWEAMGATVYYATVNPVWDNPYTTREQVANFNNRLATGLIGVDIIDSYTWLMTNGYKMVDGMHYDAATNVNIYNLFLGSAK